MSANSAKHRAHAIAHRCAVIQMLESEAQHTAPGTLLRRLSGHHATPSIKHTSPRQTRSSAFAMPKRHALVDVQGVLLHESPERARVLRRPLYGRDLDGLHARRARRDERRDLRRGAPLRDVAELRGRTARQSPRNVVFYTSCCIQATQTAAHYATRAPEIRQRDPIPNLIHPKLAASLECSL
jgi:hypothetical protein